MVANSCLYLNIYIYMHIITWHAAKQVPKFKFFIIEGKDPGERDVPVACLLSNGSKSQGVRVCDFFGAKCVCIFILLVNSSIIQNRLLESHPVETFSR